LGDALHQGPEPIVTHGWDEFVEHAALAKQRVDTSFGSVGLEYPIIAEPLEIGDPMAGSG
jgi:hypothetical protein